MRKRVLKRWILGLLAIAAAFGMMLRSPASASSDEIVPIYQMLTPEDYLTVSQDSQEKLACAPCMVTYGEGQFAVAYLADETNTVETEASTTIVCRLGLFDLQDPENGTYIDIATAGQTIGDVTVGNKAPYEPNLLKLSEKELLVIFNLRDTSGRYLYYSASVDTDTNTVTSYQPLTLDGKSWTPANIASSYNAIAENTISSTGPSGSMVFTSKIIYHDGYFYGYCGGVCSGFSGILVRSADGINWTSVMAPEATGDMKGVIECGFHFLNDTVYFCMRDISSGVYHCSYTFSTHTQLVSTTKLSNLTTSKPAVFLRDGQMYVIVNKATGDDNTVGRRNTALFYRVDPKTCGLTLVKQVFCADGCAYHCVEEYNGVNYWIFHTDARRINPYTQGRSNLAFLKIPELASGQTDSGELNLELYEHCYGRGCITAAANIWTGGAVNMSYQIPLCDFPGCDTVTITANDSQKCYVALTTSRMVSDGKVPYAEGWESQLILEPGSKRTLSIPADAQYLYLLANNAAGNCLLPSSVEFAKWEPVNPISSDWPLLNTDLTHIICYGQSFSNGSDAPYYADPTVDGVYVFGGIANSTNGTELTPLTASAGNQHPIISAGNALAQLLAEAGYDTDLVLGSYGTGGKTIAQLMSADRQAQIKEEEGYTYDILSSGRYSVFQSSVAALASYAEKTQQSISCPVIVYLQGETDQNTDQQLGYPDNPIRAGYGAGGDKEKYKEYMSRLKEDMQREVMEAYGQTEKPLFIIYQVSGTYVRTQYSSINMAQLEFAQENEDVILVQTPYFTSHYTGSHHLTVNGYRWLGEYIARYMYTALVEREKPWPMVPDEITVENETEIRIAVDGVHNGLSIDTWTVENATNGNNLYGFNVLIDGASIKPASIALSGNEILLTMPEGTDLISAEAVYVQYGGQKARGTGNIRDNSIERGFYEYLDDSADTGTGNNQGVSHSSLDENGNSIIGQKYPLYNWLASFSYEIKTGSLHTHTFEETVVQPDCIHRGYTAHACSCGEYYVDNLVNATGVHSYGAVVTAPTCTEAGFTTWLCACGDIREVGGETAALGHLEIVDPAVLPTAEKTGLTQGSHCERCKEILAAQQTLPAKGYDHVLSDGAFKVLIIGNTFAQDAADQGSGVTDSQVLHILQAMLGRDVSVTVGVLHYSASSLAWHATQAYQGTALYGFSFIDSETGVWNSQSRVSSADILSWADWDAVILQPFSVEAHSGKANPIHPTLEDPQFYPLESSTAYMLDHVNKYAPNAEIYCFMHWQRTKTNKINIYLGNHNTMAAFFPIVMEYRGTQSGARYSDVIPVGTAIQNARTTYLALLGYNTESSVSLKNDPQFGLQRDENHLSLNVGRYIAAVTFAETVIPRELRAEGYILPEIRITESVGKLPREYTQLARKAALAAVENWQNGSLGVTVIDGYEEDPTVEAGEILSSTTLEICSASDGEVLQSFIRQAVLTGLPEDFAVDAVSRTEGATIGDSFSCDVTVRFGYTSLTVTVKCAVNGHVPGDINGDGEVNNKDLTRLFKYLTSYDVEVQEAALDVNGDGEVNNKDQTRLFKYLSGYPVEIH